jgi:hypothetical protein
MPSVKVALLVRTATPQTHYGSRVVISSASRRAGALVLAIAAGALLAHLDSPADAARGCGVIGTAAFESGDGQLYSVEGELRSRGVRCSRSRKIAGSYITRTEAEGGRMVVRGFRCRGGPRKGSRFIVDCRRDAGSKRIYLEGTGGPG